MGRAVLALVLLLATCGGDEAPAPKALAPEVTLLDSGRGKKRLLRYTVEPGTTQKGVMRMSLRMGALVPAITVETPTTITVDSVSPEGDLHYSFRFGNPRAADGPPCRGWTPSGRSAERRS